MRVLVQRVARAEVRIRASDGSVRTAGRIAKGFVLLVGFTHGDGEEQVKWMAEKVVGLRIFTDAEDKMNLALADVGGALLVVSQFTLYGDA
ncbi:MAG TPA: D-aminoacyl-tRNA deacylase, partial [Gemmatimonadaceae bacterium]|nr:D-aminoacyl-tRNA deacylase [Gemmatimonadaceae bacterium]